jgi:hypothetical protein
VRAFITKYVSLSDVQADALALWCAHTHSFEACECTPYISISSIGPGCGKTRVLEVLELVVSNPWLTGRTTGPALARKVDQERPALLLDECDQIFVGGASSQALLRGVINSGYRQNGKTSYAYGPEGIKDLRTFCPKAFAGIGDLPRTIEDRSVKIVLKKRTGFQKIARLRQRDGRDEARIPRMMLARFAAMHLDALRAARPSLPEVLDDRAADVWEPLIAIADQVGGSWPQRARQAALTLCSVRKESDSETRPFRLLSACEGVFTQLGADKLETHKLVSWLLETDEWSDIDGETLDARLLSKMLTPFGIKPGKHRFGSEVRQGYARRPFDAVLDGIVPDVVDEPDIEEGDA